VVKLFLYIELTVKFKYSSLIFQTDATLIGDTAVHLCLLTNLTDVSGVERPLKLGEVE
jgi:hypothetical protein